MKNLAILSIQDVSFSYGTHEVIHNLSLDIEKGEFVGIIGPNGSGKSTLLKISAGFFKPDKGNVLFLGKDLRSYNIKDLAKDIATMPQSMDVFFPYSVEDFIYIGRYPHTDSIFFKKKTDDDFIRYIMETIDIGHLMGRRITDLSEGERQMVFLGQCIAQDPALMLLDEPVSHFDIRYQIKTLDILKDLNKDGLTIIVVLHDLNLASEFCSRIVLVSDGRIYRQGAPDEVLTYKNIEDVYKTVVVVKENPISGKPFIIPISSRYLKNLP